MSSCRALFVASLMLASPAALRADEDHPPLPASVEKFHSILSKDWHTKEGPERLQSACGNVGAYIVTARQVVADKGPDKVDAAQWQTATIAMSDASVALGAYCAAGHGGNVTAGLSTLHDRFHDLMKLVPHK
ncbi:MAG: hypothetical protein IPG54_03225 [Sphingomonadales bacterium]|jgi:hypothetical protein|nr:hypothetical protein [Sphingomonadales bacterium]MBK9003219.1 hypothetical protein [Sphingomonadales bacterium]MBK9268466.1 hypothetical protein [Sphingomonadales bacterium]MBP6433712.1 hypothetical protein [Sphingorhabdus sp.]